MVLSQPLEGGIRIDRFMRDVIKVLYARFPRNLSQQILLVIARALKQGPERRAIRYGANVEVLVVAVLGDELREFVSVPIFARQGK